MALNFLVKKFFGGPQGDPADRPYKKMTLGFSSKILFEKKPRGVVNRGSNERIPLGGFEGEGEARAPDPVQGSAKPAKGGELPIWEPHKSIFHGRERWISNWVKSKKPCER
jgi:hypothetical protein